MIHVRVEAIKNTSAAAATVSNYSINVAALISDVLSDLKQNYIACFF